MTQEKMTRLIKAAVVGGITLLVFLLSYIIYQFVAIGVYSAREKRLEEENQRLEQANAEDEADLAWAEGPGRDWLAFEWGWIKR